MWSTVEMMWSTIQVAIKHSSTFLKISQIFSKMNCTFPESEGERTPFPHVCTPQITVLVLRQPQAAFHFPPALQVGCQGCLLVLPNSVSAWVSHINLNNTKSRALLILVALSETDKEHSLHQLSRRHYGIVTLGRGFVTSTPWWRV